MSPDLFVAWAGQALSLFTLSALLWLGLTVLLNAERRGWGAVLAGGGLLLSAGVFAAHTALLALQPYLLAPELAFWQRAVWLPFVVPPYLWYVVMAWYAGRLRAGWSRLALPAMTVWGAVALALLPTDGLFPPLDYLPASPGEYAAAGADPVLLLLYPGYSLVCILLSLAALRRPGPSVRFMGDLGRRRAAPWLTAASLVLLAVGLCAGGAAGWLLDAVQREGLAWLFGPGIALLLGLDAVIAGLTALAVVLMGRAIVSYEIFTGKVLPRGGLLRQWRGSLLLAAAWGGAGAATLLLAVPPVWLLLLAGGLITALAALLSWQSYRERDRGIERLRPFVAGPRLSAGLLSPAGPADSDIGPPFRALCEDVLGARLAYLLPLSAPGLPAGPPLAYPASAPPPLASSAALAGQFPSPQTICVPVDPAQYAGAVWAAPLWSERGLAGALLLGDKRDGSLYTQEEMEIARASGERLLDLQASAAMARRLIELQRQRLAESRVLDRRARHVLHDEVLPRLHTAMLALYSSPAASGAEETVALLAGVHQQIAGLLRALPSAAAPDVTQTGLIAALRREVDGNLAGEFDAVTWRVAPEAEGAAQALSPLEAEAAFGAAREAVRNAARHDRGRDASRPLRLTITVAQERELVLVIEDDGVGLTDAHSGAEAAGGSGQGLALHSAMMAVIGGALTVERRAGGGTRVAVALPAGRPAP